MWFWELLIGIGNDKILYVENEFLYVVKGNWIERYKIEVLCIIVNFVNL